MREETIKLQLRLPVEMHRVLTEQARRERRSLNSQLVLMIERGMSATVDAR